VLFAAVGVGNVVLPPLIKYFPDRTGMMTALYSSPSRWPHSCRRSWRCRSRMPRAGESPRAVGGVRGRGDRAVGHDARARAALEPAPTTGAIDIVEEPTPRVLGRLTRIPLAGARAQLRDFGGERLRASRGCPSCSST
jgi:CP family cyanate transporter-like MFS transporter